MPPPDANRAVDILDADLAAVLEVNFDPVADALVDDRGDADAARFGERLQARRDVDAIAVNVVGFDDDIAEIDADTEHNDRRGAVLVRRQSGGALDRKRAINRIDHARKLDDGAIADQFHDAPVMGGDGWVEDGFAMPLQRSERASLVGAHQPRITDYVGCQNGRKLTVDAFFGHELVRGPKPSGEPR